jgi:hypothetical protein
MSKKSAKKVADRSKAIAKSWTDKKVAAARTTRNQVKVAGKAYSSTRAAWKALDLPPGRCISFRGKLKAAGKLAFVADDGTKTLFTIVAAD